MRPASYHAVMPQREGHSVFIHTCRNMVGRGLYLTEGVAHGYADTR